MLHSALGMTGFWCLRPTLLSAMVPGLISAYAVLEPEPLWAHLIAPGSCIRGSDFRLLDRDRD